MTLSPPTNLSAEEQEQLQQTVEMFEVIVQASPRDCQSLEILRDAYGRLGRQAEMVATARRLADTYAEMGQYSQAMLEYEHILRDDPANAEVMAAMGEVEDRLHRSGQGRAATPVERSLPAPAMLPAPEELSVATIDLPFRDAVSGGATLIAIPQTDKTPVPAARTAAAGREVTFLNDGNEPLARFLIQHRIVGEEIVSSALERVTKKNHARVPNTLGVSLIDEISRRAGIEMETLLCGVLDRSKFAYIPLENYEVDRSVVKMLPEELTLGRLIVPFDVMSRTLMVALANPFDGSGKETVQKLLDYNIQWHLASPAAITKVLSEVYRLTSSSADSSGMRLSSS